MSLGRKFIIILSVAITLVCVIVSYRSYFDAKKMWDLGPTSDLYNVHCTITQLLGKHEVIVRTLDDVELEIEMGPFDKDIKIGDNIDVVYDKNNVPITSFSKYYQTIQMALFSILITCLCLVVTGSLIAITILDNREKEMYYLDEDFADDENDAYLYDNQAVS